MLNRAVEPLYAGAPLIAREVDMLVPIRPRHRTGHRAPSRRVAGADALDRLFPSLAAEVEMSAGLG